MIEWLNEKSRRDGIIIEINVAMIKEKIPKGWHDIGMDVDFRVTNVEYRMNELTNGWMVGWLDGWMVE
jgi:hypothetical protein